MLHDIDPMLAKIFKGNALNFDKRTKINLEIVPTRQLKIRGFFVGRTSLCHQNTLYFVQSVLLHQNSFAHIRHLVGTAPLLLQGIPDPDDEGD